MAGWKPRWSCDLLRRRVVRGYHPVAAAPRWCEPLSPTRQSQWIWCFIGLALAVRSIRYLLRFPLWGDEAMLSANLLDRGYLDLLRPLDAHQVAPWLFLWVQLTLVKLLGFSEHSLRLFPFLCSLGSVLLFRRLAGRLLSGTALVAAVAVFSVSYPAVRYAAEAKPYGSDLFVSLVLLTLAAEWWRRPEQDRWLWILAAAMPVALGMSYPAVFVAGGISMATACALWNRRSRRAWLAWAGYNLALLASFACLMVFVAGPQAAAERALMVDEWKAAFPPLGSPGKFALWLLEVHAGDLLAYPVGGEHWGSLGTLVLVATALIVLFRRGRYALVVLLAGPFFLNFIAAVAHRYPYGGHVRLMLYLAPLVCLAAGLGLAVLLEPIPELSEATGSEGLRPRFWDRLLVRRRGRSPSGPWPITTALVALGLVAVACIGRDFWRPFKSEHDQRNRDFARWFWVSLARDEELVCVKTDWGKSFHPPGLGWWHCTSPMYLCNQRIYSPRHARREPPRLDRLSASRPLGCVVYRSGFFGYDRRALEAWLVEMQKGYRLLGSQGYPVPCGEARTAGRADSVEVYRFVPQGER